MAPNYRVSARCLESSVCQNAVLIILIFIQNIFLNWTRIQYGSIERSRGRFTRQDQIVQQKTMFS